MEIRRLTKIAILFIGFSFLARFLPHPPNAVPIGAMALFIGLYFSNKIGYIFPILVMFLSDLIIGFYNPYLMTTVYLGIMSMVFLGNWAKKNKNIFTIFLSILSGSIFFYLTTNFAVWFLSSWYSPDIHGLLLSYTLALPFFRNTLLGNVFYGFSFVLLTEWIVYGKSFSVLFYKQRLKLISTNLSALFKI